MAGLMHGDDCACGSCQEERYTRRLERWIATVAVVLVALSPVGRVLAAGVRDVLLHGCVR